MMKQVLRIGLPLFCLLFVLNGCTMPKDPLLRTEYLFQDMTPAEAKEMVSDYDSMVFQSDGLEIYGQILKPAPSCGAKRPVVLFFHGFAGFGRFDDIGQALCRAGCVVIIPHHRGAWGSQGKYTVSNCVRDAVNLVNYVRSPEFQKKYHTDPGRTFLAGHSMGGNTALNAASEVSGVRGIILLDPCDIGSMTQTMKKEQMLEFLVDNGLQILKTDGPEAVYHDLVVHAAKYAFPAVAQRLNGTSVLLIAAEWGLDENGSLMKNFCAAADRNQKIPYRTFKTCRCNHGMMGVRTILTHDMADFIEKCCR